MGEKISKGVYNFAELTRDPDKLLCLIIYDITDNKRRSRMVKLLESYGVRVQRSAFEATLRRNRYSELKRAVGGIIEDEDNVRIYRLNRNNEVVYMGAGSHAEADDSVIIV